MCPIHSVEDIVVFWVSRNCLSVIASIPPSKDARCTTVPLKPLSDQVYSYQCFSFFRLSIFICVFSAKVTCAFLVFLRRNGETHRNEHILSHKKRLYLLHIFDKIKVLRVPLQIRDCHLYRRVTWNNAYSPFNIYFFSILGGVLDREDEELIQRTIASLPMAFIIPLLRHIYSEVKVYNWTPSPPPGHSHGNFHK